MWVLFIERYLTHASSRTREIRSIIASRCIERFSVQRTPISYDFSELAAYYAAFSRLMDQWQRMLPEPMHHVQRPNLVTVAAF